MRLTKGIIFLIALLALLIGTSCSATRRVSVEDQRRGLLMLEGERIYKNRGFFSEKKALKRQKKAYRAIRRKSRRR